MSVSSWWILKLLTETGKYLGKKRKSNLEVLARNLSLETSQNRVSGLTWYETNLLGRSFHVVQNLYYGCNDEDNRTNDEPYREKRFLDFDWYHLRLFYCYCFSAECPNIIQCLKICFQEDVFVLHCFFLWISQNSVWSCRAIAYIQWARTKFRLKKIYQQVVMWQKNMGTHLGVAQLKSLENASLIKNVDHNMPHLVAKMTFDPIQRGGLALFSCFWHFCRYWVHGLCFAKALNSRVQCAIGNYCFLAPSGALIAIPTYYWPTPLPHFFRSHRSSTLDFHFLSNYSYIKAIML